MAALLGAGYLSAYAYAALGDFAWRAPGALVWSAAALAAFLLYDARFAELVLRQDRSTLWLAFMP